MTTSVSTKRNLNEEVKAAFDSQIRKQSPVREKLLNQFLSKGFPDSKTEEYRFTPITRILEKSLRFTPLERGNESLTPLPPFDQKTNTITFINGVFSERHLSLADEDIVVKRNPHVAPPTESDTFDLLNAIFADDEVTIAIAPNKILKHPIVISYHFDASEFVFANPRWSIVTGSNSQISVVEYVSSSNGTSFFNNKRSSISIGENAGLEYTIIQNGVNDIQLNNSLIRLAASSRASCYTFTFDGQLVRNNLTMSIDGPGVDAHLYGLYLLSNNTIADNHTVVDHRKPNSSSNELYKGVMQGNSRGVFNGKIYVRPDAQKTNAFQSNRNLLLSESATVNTKPQLEIWADDVKCSHGCTTGQLDEEALFYLRSRGIPWELAKGMMLSAFATETLSSLKNETVRNFVSGVVAGKLQHGA